MSVQANGGENESVLGDADRFGDPLPEGISLVFVEMDWQNGICRFVRSDGKEALVSNPVLSRTGGMEVIVRSTYFFLANLIMLETDRGDIIGAELPTLDNQSPVNGRPVIYLDQKDWSTLANAIHSPARIASIGERDAAQTLIELAQARKIILPLSSAHMAETCKWSDGERRYRLALTIAQLSAGWQLQDPLTVRKNELRRSFERRYTVGTGAVTHDVFTLAPNAIHSSRMHYPKDAAEDLPGDLRLAADAMTSISGQLSVMLGKEPVEQGETPQWVTKFQFITDWLADQQRDSQRRRLSTDVYFLDDAHKEMAEAAQAAGLKIEHLLQWIKGDWKEDLVSMPCLGLYREVLHGKQINGGTAWKGNDLTDLMYLTCAAGYADHVVGERSTISQMKQSNKRLGRPDNLYRNLNELVSSGALDGL